MRLSHVKELLAFLGLATFALLVALGLLVYQGESLSLAVERVAVSVVVMGIVVLEVGLFIHRRLAGEPALGVCS